MIEKLNFKDSVKRCVNIGGLYISRMSNTTKPKVVVKGKGAAKAAAKKQAAPAVEPEVAAAPTEKAAVAEPKKTLGTVKAGLNLNINLFRSWLKKFCNKNGLFVPVSTKPPKEGTKKAGEAATAEAEGTAAPAGKDGELTIPKLKGAYIAMAAATEVLCNTILRETIAQLGKEPSGLYKISRPAMKYAVMYNDELRFLFGRSLQSFNKNMMYSELFCIPEKEMVEPGKYIETVFGKQFQLEPNAYNLLAFMLNNFLTDVAGHIFNIMCYAKKRSLDYDAVICAIKNMCSGDIEHNMRIKIDGARKSYSEEDEEEATPTADAEKPEKKVKPATKKGTTPAKNAKPGGDSTGKNTDEVEDDDNSDAGDDDADGQESDEDNAEPNPSAKPTPPKKKAQST